MDFTNRKLPIEAADTLRRVPVHSIAAYTMVFAPVYAHLARNQKFVAVKGPLDFFTPDDLTKLAPLESLFFSPFVDALAPFVEAGQRVRAILRRPAYRPAPGAGRRLPVALDPAPYIASDEILALVAPLWNRSETRVVIEPFFAAAFTGAVCDPLPGELLRGARDRGLDTYETAVYRAGWAVFTALHLGYTDFEFINALRTEVFRDASGLEAEASFVTRPFRELSAEAIPGPEVAAVGADLLESGNSALAPRFAGRMKRIVELSSRAADRPTIFGERGFVDV
jgi:hypothetical protein